MVNNSGGTQALQLGLVLVVAAFWPCPTRGTTPRGWSTFFGSGLTPCNWTGASVCAEAGGAEKTNRAREIKSAAELPRSRSKTVNLAQGPQTSARSGRKKF